MVESLDTWFRSSVTGPFMIGLDQDNELQMLREGEQLPLQA